MRYPPPPLDPEHFRILHQFGNGRFLWIDEIAPCKEGGLVARRTFVGSTSPSRPEVKEEGVRIEEVRLDVAEARAVATLLDACVALNPTCAIEQPRGRGWRKSIDFTMRLRVESGGSTVWAAAYTGTMSSSGEKQYAHGLILKSVLNQALAHRTWTEAKFRAEDRARMLAWVDEHFEGEEEWVRDCYLKMARNIGDETYVPFLRKALKHLDTMAGSSRHRQIGAAREALSRITGTKE